MIESRPSLSLSIGSRGLKDGGSLSPESEDGSDVGPSPQTQGGSGVDVPTSPECQDDKDTDSSSESRHGYGIDDSSSESALSQHSYGIDDNASESSLSQHSYGINDDDSESGHSQHSYGINDDDLSIDEAPSPKAQPSLHLPGAQGAGVSAPPSDNFSAAQDSGKCQLQYF
jgi:hypothetical protein